MKTLTLCFICLLTFSYGAFASEKSLNATIEKLLEVTQVEEKLTQIIDQMLDAQVQQMPSLAPYRGVMQKFFNKYLNFETMKPQLVAMYKEVFTEEELKDIIAFYTTKTGQKAMRVLPELASKGAMMGVQLVQANAGELQQMIEEEKTRLEAEQKN